MKPADSNTIPVVYDYQFLQWRPGVLRMEDSGGRARFRLSTRSLLPGWYMIEMSVTHDRDIATSVFIASGGSESSAAQEYYVPCKQGRVSKRLCYIPVGTRQLICEPIDGEGQFTVESLRLVWLHPGFAHDRLLRRLSAVAPEWHNQPPAAIREALKARARQSGGVAWTALARKTYEQWCSHLDPDNAYARRNRLRENHEPASEPELPALTFILPLGGGEDQRDIQSTLASLPAKCKTLICAAGSTPAMSLPSQARWLDVSDEADEVGAVNAGLATLDDGYVHIICPGEKWAQGASAALAPLLDNHPHVPWLYGDDDNLAADGTRTSPRFKPDWNPDLLNGFDYIGAAGIYQVTALRQAGFWRGDNWEDARHAMHLRLAMQNPEAPPLHCPEIIRHSQPARRGRTAGSAVLAQLRASESAAELLPGQVSGSVRVRYTIPADAPKVSLLVPTRDGIDILKPCVDTLLSLTDYPDFELLVLDNQSTCEKTLRYLGDLRQRDARVRVLRYDEPFNYSAINNFGVRHAAGSVIGLINNDIEPINADWLREMVSQVMRVQIGCVGAKLYYPDDSVQHAGVVLGIGGVAGHAQKYYRRDADGYDFRLKLVQNYSAVTAACLLVRREVFEEVGGLNEENLPVAFNDVDFCLRVRAAGYRNLWTPYAELYHHESVSRGADNNRRKRARALAEANYMRERWGEELFNDPAYNPQLTLAYEDFSLK